MSVSPDELVFVTGGEPALGSWEFASAPELTPVLCLHYMQDGVRVLLYSSTSGASPSNTAGGAVSSDLLQTNALSTASRGPTHMPSLPLRKKVEYNYFRWSTTTNSLSQFVYEDTFEAIPTGEAYTVEDDFGFFRL